MEIVVGSHFIQRIFYRVLYIQDALEGTNMNRRVFLDPNTFSQDGTVDLVSPQSFSSDGQIFAYTTSTNGSDWRILYFRNVTSNENLGDVLVKVKSTSIVWKGNEGIFYGVSYSFIKINYRKKNFFCFIINCSITLSSKVNRWDLKLKLA